MGIPLAPDRFTLFHGSFALGELETFVSEIVDEIEIPIIPPIEVETIRVGSKEPISNDGLSR